MVDKETVNLFMLMIVILSSGSNVDDDKECTPVDLGAILVSYIDMSRLICNVRAQLVIFRISVPFFFRSSDGMSD